MNNQSNSNIGPRELPKQTAKWNRGTIEFRGYDDVMLTITTWTNFVPVGLAS